MPYKNKEDQYECQKRWYYKNHDEAKKTINKSNRKRRKEMMEWYKNLKKKLKCEKCSENHTACLVFHHKDPKKKNDTVCQMARAMRPKKLILEEIEKCQVLCANCHRKLHHKERAHS